MTVKLPTVRDLVKLYGLSAKATLSQNFIFDKNITDKIVRCAGITSTDALVVEVGPGPGLLTRSVLDTNVPNVVALEKDTRFIPTLKQLADATDHRLKILQGDAMKVPHSEILKLAGIPSTTDPNRRIHIIGNLPFNVATPLLIQWLHLLQQRSGVFGSSDVWMTLMFQKEVAQRICAPVNTPERGRLSVMAQTLCSVQIPYVIPSSAFLPRPKVDAAIVHLRPLQQQQTIPFPLLEDVLRFFFTRKRKSASHILNLLQSQLDVPLKANGIENNSRPENIATQQFIDLAKSLHDTGIARLP